MKKVMLIAGLMAASTAFAGDDSYMEFSHIGLKYTEPGITTKPTAFRGILGFKQSDNLAYEAVLGAGISDGTFRYYNANGTLGVSSMVGFFAKASNKLSDDVEVFARAGLVSAKVNGSASAGGYRVSQGSSGSDFAYGVGIKYNLTKDYGLVLDYMNYYNKSDIKIQGLSVGVSLKY